MPKPVKSAVTAATKLAALLRDAAVLTDEMNFEGAALLYDEAVKLAPDSVPVLDAAGDAFFAVGDGARASAAYTRSIALEPAGSYTKHLQLAQLLEGQAAAACVTTGIRLLQAAVDACAPGSAEGVRLRRELAVAHCAAAELYMTDLCDAGEAEAAAETHATAAVAADGDNPEALRVLADVRLCQSRPADSVPLITKAITTMLGYYPPDEGEGEDDAGMATAAAAAAATEDLLHLLPPLPARKRAAQIAMEVEAYVPAASLLTRLLEEDDADMEVWYLLVEACLHSGDVEGASEYAATAVAKLVEEGKRRAGGGAVSGDEGSGLAGLTAEALGEQLTMLKRLQGVVAKAMK